MAQWREKACVQATVTDAACRPLPASYCAKPLLIDCCGVTPKYVCMYLREPKCRLGLTLILLVPQLASGVAMSMCPDQPRSRLVSGTSSEAVAEVSPMILPPTVNTPSSEPFTVPMPFRWSEPGRPKRLVSERPGSYDSAAEANMPFRKRMA